METVEVSSSVWVACTANEHHMCRGFHSMKCNCSNPPKPCGCKCHATTVVVKPPTKENKMTTVAPVALVSDLTPAPASAPAAAPVATETVTVAAPAASKPVKAPKAPWKCLDCPTMLHPTGKRGRPAHRCDSCKAALAKAKADEAAAKAKASASVEVAVAPSVEVMHLSPDTVG